MPKAKRKRRGETAQHLDSSTLPLDGPSIFEKSDSSVLRTEHETTPFKRQEKAMSNETEQAPESSIRPLLVEPQSLKEVTVQFL